VQPVSLAASGVLRTIRAGCQTHVRDYDHAGSMKGISTGARNKGAIHTRPFVVSIFLVICRLGLPALFF